jgi:hypothetical protein
VDKVWSFRSKISVPISHVVSIENVDPSAMNNMRLIKVAGAGVGHYKVGTFLELKHGQKNKLVFCDVHHSQENTEGKIIAIKLHDEHFEKIILEVDNSEYEELVKIYGS